MELLERSAVLAELDEALAGTATGAAATGTGAGNTTATGAGTYGRIVLVAGEAGIGKSALVRAFIRRHEGAVRFRTGLCDPLLTPRTLGPLHDIARQSRDGLAAALTAETRERVFGGLLDELARRGPRQVIVLEDMHWADEATLDLLTFLGRRLEAVPAVLIVSYRDDELGMDHPLRAALSGLPPERVHHVRLARLSEQAVATLARRAGRPAGDLHAVTGGNPFLVTEMLAAGEERVPRTVKDLVLARLGGLGAAEQDLVRFVAVIPGWTELWILEEALRPDPAVLESCTASGLLVMSDEAVGFRHELARQAVEESLSALRRRELNRLALGVLSSGHDAEPARLTHHALIADDARAVLRHAPAAARRAAAVGAHRDAAGLYRAALRHAGGLAAPARAELLEGHASHGHLAGLVDEALGARQEALAVWEEAGRDEKIGENLYLLSELYWWRGRRAAAETAAARAVALLERGAPGRHLAMAYSNQARLEMLAYRWTATMDRASKAMAVAREVGDRRTLAHALTSVGSVRLGTGDAAGRADLEEAVAVALGEGMHDQAARALLFLARIPLEYRDYRQARGRLDQALDFALAHDLVGYARYVIGTRAWWRLDQGDWAGAERDAREALGGPEQPGIGVWFALVQLGRLQARRDDAEAAETLRAARRYAVGAADPLVAARVAAARAEHAWLCDDQDRVVGEAARGFEQAVEFGGSTPRLITASWYAGELAWWLWRAGHRPRVPEWIAEPYRLLIDGRWRRAAQAWADLGCPYEQADALACGDEDSALTALRTFDRLGATAAARLLRRRLRAGGRVRIPRGPRPATAANPANLTARQLEVLTLITARLSNVEIADRLMLSVRTVDSHVAAVLAKLRVSTRREAATAARRLGIAPPGERPT